jgi:hypothetical protein
MESAAPVYVAMLMPVSAKQQIMLSLYDCGLIFDA